MQDFYDAIKTLASGRVFPMVAPHGASYPMVVYTLVGQEQVLGINGLHGLRRVRIQVDAYAQTYSAAMSLQDQVLAAIMANKSTVAEVRMVLTDFEDATRVYRVAVDFIYYR